MEVFDQPAKVKTYTLNTDQQEAFDWLEKFCTTDNGWSKVLLDGSAGTGKSFTISRLVEKLTAAGVVFGVTAPTHKAVRVLRKLSDISDKVEFGTIHSFLGLKEKYNEYTGELEYEPDYNSGRERKIDGIRVLILDEASMLHDKLYGHIEDELRSKYYLKLIMMGDEPQIPPVRKNSEKNSSRLKKAIPFIPEYRNSYRIHHLRLTKPQRQALDSPILKYAYAVLAQYKQPKVNFDFLPEYKEHLERLDRNAIALQPVLEELFTSPEFERDADYAKVIAWRNDTVEYFNRWIRKIIYKKDTLPRLIADDKLIMDKAIVKNDKVILPNNEEVIVESATESDFVLTLKKDFKSTYSELSFGEQTEHMPVSMFDEIHFKVYRTVLVTQENFKHEVSILHESEEARFNLLLQKLTARAKAEKDSFSRRDMWKEFWSIQRKFAWVKHNYCITAHKAQGSTYRNCISMEWDMEVNRDIEERNSLRYVAATRASHKLFIVK